ncbi:MAG TPA: signal peptidase I [Microbacterium sp.]|nr:signal peptidase I [Microbacterium sp.]
MSGAVVVESRAAMRRARRRRPRPVSVIGDALLWIAAALGLVCLVLTVLAFTLHISLIMFRTGSMDPTIPTGSVAIVREIPASDIAVGDIVTVDRGDDQLPITHRVTSVGPGATEAERILTMRGDANEQDDPYPYTVTSVREVIFSVPGLAQGIASLGNPLVMGALTLAAGLLVGWAFWPREREADRGAG